MGKSTNNKPINGVHTEWYKNGNKESEINFTNGKINGLWTEWYENGNKRRESTYKDDYRDGLYTTWYKNGQKKCELIYFRREAFGDDHRRFSRIEKLGEWNEDGSIKE